MPSCGAHGCSNTSGRTEGKSYFIIPDPAKNRELCVRWLHNTGNSSLTISNFVYKRSSVVCSDHFHPLCFERDIRSEICPSFKKKVKLVPGAIPTIFKHRTYDQINIDGTVCSNRKATKRSMEMERTEVSIVNIFPLLNLTDTKRCFKFN